MAACSQRSSPPPTPSCCGSPPAPRPRWREYASGAGHPARLADLARRAAPGAGPDGGGPAPAAGPAGRPVRQAAGHRDRHRLRAGRRRPDPVGGADRLGLPGRGGRLRRLARRAGLGPDRPRPGPGRPAPAEPAGASGPGQQPFGEPAGGRVDRPGAGADPGPAAARPGGSRSGGRSRRWPPRCATRPGLLARFGVGEAPLGWQGTVSVWRDPADLVAFAYRHPEHRAAIARTPTDGLVRRGAVRPVRGARRGRRPDGARVGRRRRPSDGEGWTGMRLVRVDSRTTCVRRLDDVVAVYGEAMGYRTELLEARRGYIATHVRRPGFRAVASLTTEGTSPASATATLGGPGQWWHDQVRRALDAADPQALADRLLRGGRAARPAARAGARPGRPAAARAARDGRRARPRCCPPRRPTSRRPGPGGCTGGSASSTCCATSTSPATSGRSRVLGRDLPLAERPAGTSLGTVGI